MSQGQAIYNPKAAKVAMSAREIARLIVAHDIAAMPRTKRGVLLLAKRQDWVKQKRSGRDGGGGFEYMVADLPIVLKSHLIEEINIDKIDDQVNAFGERLIGSSPHSNSDDGDDRHRAVPMDAAVSSLPTHPVFSLSENQQDRAQARLYILNSFENFLRGYNGMGLWAGLNGFCGKYNLRRLDNIDDKIFANIKSISARTLYAWRKARHNGRINKLTGKYGNRKGSGVIDKIDGLRDLMIALITYNGHLTAGHMRDQIRARYGRILTVEGAAFAIPSCRTITRWKNDWITSNKADYVAIINPDRAKSHYKVSFGDHYGWVSTPNQLWEIDATPADVMLEDGRYSVYVVIDVFTRRLLVHVSKTPRTTASLALIKRAVSDWGVPETIRTDNGSDFISKSFKMALSALGIYQDISQAFTPTHKGMVERSIGTLNRDLMTLLPGFLGHDIVDRKAIEARKTFAQRLGDDIAKCNIINMSADGLQKACDDWAKIVYQNRVHGGLNGISPAQKIASFTGNIRKIEDDAALAFLCAAVDRNGERVVAKTGIAIENATFIAAEMALYIGQKVYVRLDPDDMGVCYIFDVTGQEFLFKAVNAASLGIDRRAISMQAAAIQDQQRNRARKQARSIKIKPRDLIDGQIAAAIDKGQILPLPKASNSYETVALKSAAGIQTAPEISADNDIRQEALVKEIAKASNITNLPESPKQRFKRAVDLQDKMMAGVEINTSNAVWLGGYTQSSEYRAHKQMFDDFGKNWIEA